MLIKNEEEAKKFIEENSISILAGVGSSGKLGLAVETLENLGFESKVLHSFDLKKINIEPFNKKIALVIDESEVMKSHSEKELNNFLKKTELKVVLCEKKGQLSSRLNYPKMELILGGETEFFKKYGLAAVCKQITEK